MRLQDDVATVLQETGLPGEGIGKSAQLVRPPVSIIRALFAHRPGSFGSRAFSFELFSVVFVSGEKVLSQQAKEYLSSRA